LVPTKVNAAMAATAIKAAISAYSIAVTPDSSWSSFEKSVRNEGVLCLYEATLRLQVKPLKLVKPDQSRHLLLDPAIPFYPVAPPQ
jgi:hypothetical protein